MEATVVSSSEPKRISRNLIQTMSKRRSVRSFSKDPVDMEVIENAVKVAVTAPSGANRQPWYFAIITDREIRRQIRDAAERVEFDFYNGKAGETWLNDLKPFGTNHLKPYLTEAGALIAVFSRTSSGSDDAPENRLKTYYPIESTGIATGFLISALHQSGLATLTHTPKPMFFLNQILNLDKTYRPFMIIVAGHANASATLPEIGRKPFHEVSCRY